MHIRSAKSTNTQGNKASIDLHKNMRYTYKKTLERGARHTTGFLKGSFGLRLETHTKHNMETTELQSGQNNIGTTVLQSSIRVQQKSDRKNTINNRAKNQTITIGRPPSNSSRNEH